MAPMPEKTDQNDHKDKDSFKQPTTLIPCTKSFIRGWYQASLRFLHNIQYQKTVEHCLQDKEVKWEPKISYPLKSFFKHKRYKQNSGNIVYTSPSQGNY